MQQKEARSKHPCVLPKNVAFLVWVPDSVVVGNDGCFLRASFCTAATAKDIVGSTQEAPNVFLKRKLTPFYLLF